MGEFEDAIKKAIESICPEENGVSEKDLKSMCLIGIVANRGSENRLVFQRPATSPAPCGSRLRQAGMNCTCSDSR